MSIYPSLTASPMVSPNAAPVELRRDPLTGQFVQIEAATPRTALTQRLQANALPLSTDIRYANPNDPLLQLESAERNDDAFWQVHAETLWSRPLPLSQAEPSAYFARALSAVEALLERSDLADISIIERHQQGSLNSYIYGWSELTARAQAIESEALRWSRRTGGDLLVDVLTSELVDGSRILLKTEHWIAYLPYASTAPLEILLMPKQTSRTLADFSDAARADLADVYRRIFPLLFKVAGAGASFTACWTMAPAKSCPHISRLHLRITGETLYGSTLPETLAQELRGLL